MYINIFLYIYLYLYIHKVCILLLILFSLKMSGFDLNAQRATNVTFSKFMFDTGFFLGRRRSSEKVPRFLSEGLRSSSLTHTFCRCRCSLTRTFYRCLCLPFGRSVPCVPVFFFLLYLSLPLFFTCVFRLRENATGERVKECTRSECRRVSN